MSKQLGFPQERVLLNNLTIFFVGTNGKANIKYILCFTFSFIRMDTNFDKFLCAYLNPPGLRIPSKLLNCSVCLVIYLPSTHNIDLTLFIWESLLLSKCLSQSASP